MSIRLLLGRTRALRRQALAHDDAGGFATLDALGRPTFLYITDSVRKARRVEREFTAYKDRKAFAPRTTTLASFLERMASAHGDGRVAWSTDAAALVAEGMLAQSQGWLAGLGDPARVGADLAALRDAWAEAGHPDLAGRRGLEIVEFLRRLTEALDASAARSTPSTLLAQLSRKLDAIAEGGARAEALLAWLRRERAVVIDDVLHPSPQRRQLLVKLCRAWDAVGTHVVVSFESGRDLGGREIEAFFEYGDDDEIGLSLRAFQATRALRRDCFSGLVAEGGADLARATPTGPEGLDLAGELAPEEGPLGLADALDTGGCAEAPSAVRFVAWPSPADEVRGIAEAVKDALLAGADAGDCWVSFPGLPAYAPVVRRTFGELGIPCAISTGTPAAELPAGRWLADLARAAAEGSPVQTLLAACASGLSGIVDEASALALARHLRERGTGLHPGTWPAALVADLPAALRPALAALDALHQDLRPIAGDVDPRAWADTLLRVGERHGVLARIEAAAVEPELRARSARAFAAAVGAIDEVARATLDARPGSWPAARLARLFDERVAGARLREPGSDGRVQVVGVLELRGIHPRHLWIGGLVADDFPARPGGDYLVAPEHRRALDLPDPGAEARFLLASAVRNAEAGGHRLTLSWPVARDGKACAVSPTVEDFLRVRLAPAAPTGAEAEEPRGVASLVEHPAPSGRAYSRADVDRVVAVAHEAGGAAHGWEALGRGSAAYGELAAPARARAGDALGAYDGILERPATLPAALGVSRFEAYLACPARAWYGMLLGLDAEEDFDPDLDPSERGSLVHGVLQRFVEALHQDGKAGVAGADGGDREAARALLLRALDDAMAADEGVARLPAVVREARRRALASGLDGKGPRGVLAAWLLQRFDDPAGTEMVAAEWSFDRVAVGPIQLRGRADRVDRLPSGDLWVVDYKTGTPPDAKRIGKGLVAQGLVYSDAAKAAYSAPAAAAVYQPLKKPSEAGRGGWIGDRAALAAAGAGKDALELDGEQGRAVREHQRGAAEKLAAGRFHTTLAGAEDAGCRYCDFAKICRVDHARNARIAEAGDPRWLLPIEDPA